MSTASCVAAALASLVKEASLLAAATAAATALAAAAAAASAAAAAAAVSASALASALASLLFTGYDRPALVGPAWHNYFDWCKELRKLYHCRSALYKFVWWQTWRMADAEKDPGGHIITIAFIVNAASTSKVFQLHRSSNDV